MMYKSLVFMDLEATDLPQFRPEITEISFVAVSCDHFVNLNPGTEALPRVQHKLTLCINPAKRIVPEAVIISGLDNFLLERENILNARTARLLSTFLDHLQQPVCLVAHNGRGFDFPLLARTLNEYNMVMAVHCVDSLPIFKQIDEDNKEIQSLLDSELEELNKEADAVVLQPPMEAEAAGEPSSSSTQKRPASPDMFADMIDDDLLTQLTDAAEAEFLCTPDSKRIKLSSSPPKIPQKPKGARIDRSRIRGRCLFQRSYSLSSIFHRFYGHFPPNTHRAEEDSLILLKCARFFANDFVRLLEDNARELQSFLKK